MNKKILAFALLGMSMALSLPSQARNVKYMQSISEALGAKDASGTVDMSDDADIDDDKAKLDGSIKFFFGPQKHPAILQRMRVLHTTVRALSSGEGEVVACGAALRHALAKFQKNAKKLGGNAVINIATYFKTDDLVLSETKFECHAGSRGVILMIRGDVATIADQ